MRKSICLAIILAVFCMEEVPAQKIAKTKENPAVKAYSDSLSALAHLILLISGCGMI